MNVSSRAAEVFAIVRGFQLAALTVPWLLHKVRQPGVTESERSLVFMIGSRSVLLGLVMVVLGFAGKREPAGWVLLGDGLLQLCDAAQAVALGRRKVAILPAVLCALDVAAGLALLVP